MRRVRIYKRFERFWHWSQALLVLGLAFTGFNLHGTFSVLPFGRAHMLHQWLAWALLGLWVFAIFWHVTTGEWRHYIPTLDKLAQVTRFYAVGIFRGEHHPYRKTEVAKLNPLQRLSYLGLKLGINPAIIVTGLFYMYYNSLKPIAAFAGLDLGTIAIAHTVAAFVMVAFVVIHVYLTTTGHTVFAHIKAMITGWEDLEEDEAAAAVPERHAVPAE